MILPSTPLLAWLLASGFWLLAPGFSLPAAEPHEREFTEQSTREFTLARSPAQSVLSVHNVKGAVHVQGYTGSKIVVQITRKITAPDDKSLEEGKKEAALGFEQRGDSVLIFTQAPHDSHPHHRNRSHDHQDEAYDYAFDLTIKVPHALNVSAATVLDGAVEITDVHGAIQAKNVNGAIQLHRLKGPTKAHTVNGSIDADYLASPAGSSSFKTVNGNITVAYPPDLSADLGFKTFHGELYTDFETTDLPAQLTRNERGKGSGTRYTINRETRVRVGKGGATVSLETLNGNLTVKRQRS